MGCGEGLVGALDGKASGVLEEEDAGEGVFSVVFLADGVHKSLIFLALL